MIELEENFIDFPLGTKAFEISASIENLGYFGKSVVGFGSYFHFL